ncbi:MAG: tripartite tricarboxylate transporter permease [Chloroflexales bacterium]|nr:tripartite tricarboxylate transporter permease [Chloroflexales bacterium]
MEATPDIWANILNGFAVVLTPQNLLFVAIGVLVGTAIGVLPGIGPSLTISLLLPVTFGLEPTSAFVMFGGIFYGAMYGGSTTSILVNTPGESSSVVTAVDGFQMAKKGRGGAALATAAIGSFFAGTIATLCLMLIAPLLVRFALSFGPPEYFAIMLLALSAVTGLAGRSAPKALFATLLGLGIGMVGIDLQTGQARFTFDNLNLLGGIDAVMVAIGLFAVGEVFWAAATIKRIDEETVALRGSLLMSREEWQRSWPSWMRGTAIGFITGILPGAGATVASFLSYNAERRFAKGRNELGQGAIEGVAGPEAANNASAGGALVPLLALGIPGSATTAVMLVAFQLYGLRPGPLLFAQQSELVWGLIASLYIANAALLLLNLPMVRLWVRLLDVPKPVLYTAILAFSFLGVYSDTRSVFSMAILLVIGIIGFLLRRFDFPLAPVVLGAVLGPLIEQEFRRSLAISVNDYSIFFTRPLSGTIMALVVVSFLVPLISLLWQRRSSAPKTASSG